MWKAWKTYPPELWTTILEKAKDWRENLSTYIVDKSVENCVEVYFKEPDCKRKYKMYYNFDARNID